MRNIFLPTEEVPRIACVYAILNTATSECYIGGTKHFHIRKRGHLTFLKYDKHRSKKLQSCWNPSCFVFAILEQVTDLSQLRSTEQRWLDLIEPAFNSFKDANGGKGYVHSLETRAKNSAANKGRAVSEETKERLRDYSKGRVVSEETREKLRKAHTGRKMKEDVKEKLRLVKTGKRHTEESKRLMSQKHLENNWSKGIKYSQERCEQMRDYWNNKYENGFISPNSVAIIQLTLDGVFVQEWVSAAEAARKLGLQHSCITSCAAGKRNKAGNFKWLKAKDYYDTYSC